MPDSPTDDDDLTDAFSASSESSGAAPTHPSVDFRGAALVRKRNERGQYTSGSQGRRRCQAPAFRVVEVEGVKPPACSAAATNDHPSGCAAATRCAAHRGTQCRRWIIRGPLSGCSDDAERLSAVVVVRAAAWMPPLEVYVRALSHLVPAIYGSRADAIQSVAFVASAWAQEAGGWHTGEAWSSFRGLGEGQALSSEDLQDVARRAATATATSRSAVAHGHVSFVQRRNVTADPVYLAATRAAKRRASRVGARTYKRKGEEAARGRWAQLLRDGHSAGSVARTRAWVELDHRGDRSGRSRAGRLRLSHGLSQMHLFPTRAELREERRVAFERDGVGHFFFTRAVMGGLLRWDYIGGSGAAGVRRYQCRWGQQKRLKSHANAYWEDAGVMGGTGVGVRGGSEEVVSEDEDGGIFFFNASTETEGCYAEVPDDPKALAALQVHAESYLEDLDGGSPLKILAVAFDVQEALQLAIDQAAVAGATVSRIATASPAVLTFAADGGTIKRRQLTALTVSLSSPLLAHGRTNLTPVAYVLSGEKVVDRGLWAFVWDTLKTLIQHTFTVAATPEVEGSQALQSVDACGGRRPLRLCHTISVCCRSASPWRVRAE